MLHAASEAFEITSEMAATTVRAGYRSPTAAVQLGLHSASRNTRRNQRVESLRGNVKMRRQSTPVIWIRNKSSGVRTERPPPRAFRVAEFRRSD
jgi:hypothetical protein